MSSPLVENQVYIIVLDIEGTTTPVEFVYKTLFPYSNRKFESFLREHFREPEVESLVQQLYFQHQTDERRGLQPSAWIDDDKSHIRSCVEYCRWLMARDSKSTPFKSLQGKIWQEGYALGELHGQVYADVPPAFSRWRLQKREICIYSSGSVLAQQLLFRSTSYGDLTPQISAFFDTRIGAKTETESYRKALTHNPRDLLFISDGVKDIRAACDAGAQAIICDRDVQAPQLRGEEGKTVIHSFEEVFPE